MADTDQPERRAAAVLAKSAGNDLYSKGDFDGAEASYRKAVEIDPSLEAAWFNLGNVLQNHKDDVEGAEAAFRKAVEADPTSVQAWFNLGALLLHSKQVCAVPTAPLLTGHCFMVP